MQKITPHLWFDKNAEEAANFYASVFKNSSVGSISRYPKEGQEVHGMPEGTAMTVPFTLEGQEFLALNGGPIFKFSEAISFIIDCADQAEVDYFWDKLSADPAGGQCGWTKDKFGLSWQVIPRQMSQLISDPDKEKAGRVMNAMLKMKKIDVAELEKAARGE